MTRVVVRPARGSGGLTQLVGCVHLKLPALLLNLCQMSRVGSPSDHIRLSPIAVQAALTENTWRELHLEYGRNMQKVLVNGAVGGVVWVQHLSTANLQSNRHVWFQTDPLPINSLAESCSMINSALLDESYWLWEAWTSEDNLTIYEGVTFFISQKSQFLSHTQHFHCFICKTKQPSWGQRSLHHYLESWWWGDWELAAQQGLDHRFFTALFCQSLFYCSFKTITCSVQNWMTETSSKS